MGDRLDCKLWIEKNSQKDLKEEELTFIGLILVVSNGFNLLIVKYL